MQPYLESEKVKKRQSNMPPLRLVTPTGQGQHIMTLLFQPLRSTLKAQTFRVGILLYARCYPLRIHSGSVSA